MSVDVVVTATAFMDITFIGLESIPRPGEERFAGDLLRSPGGGAINAIGAARLGLRTALAAPLGQDLEGDFIREELTREGVALSTGAGARTPTTVVMPWGGERAMVTYEPGASSSAEEVAAFEPRAPGGTMSSWSSATTTARGEKAATSAALVLAPGS